MNEYYAQFFRTLGLPDIHVHFPRNHFDFTRNSRRILVVGPMGSGKTEFAGQIWRDSQVVLRKSDAVLNNTRTDGADLREVFFVRSRLDRRRFPDYPDDALAYRGGFDQLGDRISDINSSFELEALIEKNRRIGTWIIDEASFYDERIAYVINQLSLARGLVFVLPTLILNFRNTVFNTTASILLDLATDVFPVTAYCEHHACLKDSSFTYRYYEVDGRECPAFYFDPLIIVGGDRKKSDGREPNYATRCADHHVLPAKDYTYLILKPLGEEAAKGEVEPLKTELKLMNGDVEHSQLGRWILEQNGGSTEREELYRNALLVPCIAERALVYLFAEENLLSELQLRELSVDLKLDIEFLSQRLADNRRPVEFRLGFL